MTIDFSKQNTVEDKYHIVYQLYERFNLNYGYLVDMNLVKEAMSNIKSYDPNGYIPEEVKIWFDKGYRAYYYEGKIYIKDDFEIETLFHEILHYVTKDHHGLAFSILKSYTDEEFDEMTKKYGEQRFMNQIGQLDESFTRFITEIAIPEVKVKDAYEYGAIFVKTYFDSLLDEKIDPRFIFNLYFSDSQQDGLKFKESIGVNFESVIDSIDKIDNKSFYMTKVLQGFKKHKNIEEILGKMYTELELKEVARLSVSNLKVR